MNPSHEAPHNPSNNNPCDREPHGPEAWVRDAIAQQEEHLTRNRSCMGTLGRPHTYRTFGVPDSDGTIKNTATYQGCIVCGVTETDPDYQIKLAALGHDEDT